MRYPGTKEVSAVPSRAVRSITLRQLSQSCLLLAFLLLTGCAPVFSEVQGARLVGKGNIETTASFSSVDWSDDGESEHIQNHVGLQAAYGVSDRADLRFRFERIIVDTNGGDSFGVNVLGFGPKLELAKDRAALYLPVGFAFGEEIDEVSETLEFHPTLLFSIPGGKNFELNPSVKALVPTNDRDLLVAVNLGAGLSTDLQRWVLRPEFGFLFNPGEEGHYRQFSLGLTVYQ
jgi:hypothetical protein